ncbi:uncharacterized protein BO87DRAFT_418040 [Aspergillus neoniger CBS 115656]|uniref:Uncharacterized protein n=1 Tax=Aspergillus neoniger (strain CBS 115656) TaxID=1448310 RepID=A0A318YB09_ASPNB|nr:hypothetical protein BO87DRAFT_418040 [Aspergillus neoniger CBS 115656]PYH31536.1 hypothetical protein BO87DRAFT_418040 [Aspergillus neoniger CBS 115656]
MPTEAFHRLSRADFTIAIICPLPLEAEVAIPLFDTVYDRTVYEKYGPVRNDPNHYTLGRIGCYNVVLVHMGGCGKAESSSVASNIKQSYPGIELALLIGICGGVPYRTDVGPIQHRRDVFLGDVIISSAIIQYDLGKRLPHRFVRKNTLESNLGRASLQIRSFMTCLESRHGDLSKDQQGHLQTIQGSKDVPYPGIKSDILFKAEYKHRVRCLCMSDASGDQSVVDRRRVDSDGTPYIHIGRLASGDTVMCSAKDRDKISKREEVLGFEMEGACVWDNIPCILIKGVSDYADSHKNDTWQYYAAASAAACMRALLDQNPIPNVTSSAGLAQGMPAETSEDSSNEREKACLDLLTFPQAQYRLDEIMDPLNTTCTWVLERPEYKTWMSGEDLKSHGGFFWIKGKPGAGKSTLMKHLLSKAKQTGKDTIISSFFFHAQGVDLERSTVGMYRSLLHQLLSSTAVPSSAKQPYFSFAAKMLSQDDGINWTIRDLKHQLLSLIRLLNNRYVFFFIDALDECHQAEMEDMIPFLEHLGHSLNASDVHLRICLASRHYPQLNIERGIEWVLEYQQEHQGDMRKYVETKLKGGKSKMLQEIREEVCARASGVFLWVILVVRSLNDAFAKGKIHAVRQRLDEIPDGLDELFTDMLTRDTEEIDDLIFCLRLILFAQRPLSKDEFYFGVMFTKNGLIKREGEWHIDPHIENSILNVSKGLVEITRTKARIVHFIHESVRDFLLRRDGFSRLQAGSSANTIGNAHNELAQICFRYICQIKLMAAKEPRRCVWPPQAENYLNSETRFLNYAIHSLLPHSNAAEAGGTSQAAFLQAFSLSFEDFKHIRNALTLWHIRQYGSDVTILYVLAELNLDHLIRLELLRTPQIWKQMGRYHSPMGAAVYLGNALAIRALLGCNTSSDASVDNSLLEAGVIDRMKQYVVNSKRIKMKRGSLALYLVEYAIKRGHVAILKLLYLTGKIDLNHKLNCRSLPLICAIKCSKAEIVEFLLSCDRVTIASPTNALRIAITRGKRDVCSALLSSPYSLRWLDSSGGVAIHWAVIGNNGSTMRHLLELGCDVTLRDRDGRDALSHAAEQGKIEMMKILIESGVVDIDGKDSQGRTALSWAAGPNNKTLNRSPDPNKCWDQLQKEAMYVLLSMGSVDVNSRDKHQWTPLLWAVQRNKPVAVDILLEASETEVDCRSVTGKTPLTVAAMCGHEAMLCKLLQSGRADVNSQDIFGRTPLSWAVYPCAVEWIKEEDKKVMQLLIDHLSKKNKSNDNAVLPLDRETLEREIQVVAASYTPYDY